MEQFYLDLTRWVDHTAYNIWSYLLFLLFAVGAWLTINTGFIQFRRLGDSFKLIFAGFLGKKKARGKEGDVSPFAALSTALAATVGNGNIGGVATALFTGGPGAIFWLWICGLVGMATKFSEALLGVKFREKYPDGKIAGGPMYYIKNGFKNKRLAAILAPAFAVCGALATLFGTGNMMQANQMALAFNSEFGIPKAMVGGIVTFLVALVVIGGIKRIGAVAEKIVPTMLIIYFVFGFIVIIAHITFVPKVLYLIFQHAFTPSAAVGGFLGATVKRGMQMGFRRGLLTNEAGLGSAPIAHAAAPDSFPRPPGIDGHRRGFHRYSRYLHDNSADQPLHWHVAERPQRDGHDRRFLLQDGVPVAGGLVVAFSSFLFGYTTLIGWYYYGEQCMKFLFGIKVTYPYRVIFVSLVFIGSVISIELVFYIGDIANAFMSLPNLVALTLLSGTVASTAKSFFKKYPRIEDFDK